jgi:hypothetical protein
MKPALPLAAALLLAAVTAAAAQTPDTLPLDSLRDALRLPELATHARGGYAPAPTISTPTAYGADWGQQFFGASYQERTRFTDLQDAAFAAGLGFGDARRWVGLEVAVTSYSVRRDGGPFATGGVSFKLHRLLPGGAAVAVGVENVTSWGGSDAGRSPYAVASKIFRLNDDPRRRLGAVVATAGVGTGRFRSEDDIAADEDTPTPFGSVALVVAEPVSVIANWTGQELAVGTSFLPFRRLPLVFTPALTDLTHRAGDGARFVLGIGYGFRYPLF